MFLNSLYALVESQILYKTERSNLVQITCFYLIPILFSTLSLTVCSGGAKRSRTVDLLRARQALYQLSYGPIIKWWV